MAVANGLLAKTMYPSPSEIVLGILGFMPSTTIPAPLIYFQNALFKIKSEGKYEELLKNVTFDNSLPCPSSEDIDRLLFFLLSSNVLRSSDYKSNTYYVTSDNKNVLVDNAKRVFCKKQLEQLSELSIDINSQLIK